MQRPQGGRARIVDSPEAAQALFASVFERARDERLCVAHLDAGDVLIGLRIRYAAPGQPVEFPIRAIIADAIQLGSAAIIVAHNHPSADPEPSQTDKDATSALIRVAGPIGLRLRDHLIFGGGRFVSFRQRGLL